MNGEDKFNRIPCISQPFQTAIIHFAKWPSKFSRREMLDSVFVGNFIERSQRTTSREHDPSSGT